MKSEQGESGGGSVNADELVGQSSDVANNQNSARNVMRWCICSVRMAMTRRTWPAQVGSASPATGECDERQRICAAMLDSEQTARIRP